MTGPASPAGPASPSRACASGSPDEPDAHAQEGAREALVNRLRAAGCVWAEDEADLLLAEPALAEPGALEAAVARRAGGEPLELVLGWAEVAGARVPVAPGVFVPRQRSALLVRLAAARLAPADVLVDLCCGTGALGLAVARAVPGVALHAADVDPAAVAVARRALAGVGEVHEGDLDAALPPALAGRVAVLLCNAPYVPSASVALLPAEARDHEHRVALDGGADGLDVHRRVAALAPRWLRPGGALVLETSDAQAPGTAAACAAAGLVPVVEVDDDLGATAVVAVSRG